MSRDEMRRRLRDAIGGSIHRAPDWLDTCARCGAALDERRGHTGRSSYCSACALALDDARERRAAP